ncbi:MAG: MarR family transcriptional regulator [Methanoregula sp.]|uniref:MarR family transcriptional regulator n=1 Tax=Methanoregula sp. TaxID=2052170 RepID=UPI003BB13734
MKESDTDWLVYHIIAQEPAITAAGLAEKSGISEVEIATSLDRLERSFLIDRKDGAVRVLSIGEALIKCQAKYDNTLPYIIEDGMIKARKKDL